MCPSLSNVLPDAFCVGYWVSNLLCFPYASISFTNFLILLHIVVTICPPNHDARQSVARDIQGGKLRQSAWHMYWHPLSLCLCSCTSSYRFLCLHLHVCIHYINEVIFKAELAHISLSYSLNVSSKWQQQWYNKSYKTNPNFSSSKVSATSPASNIKQEYHNCPTTFKFQ